jgi:hypothetical protein
MNVAPQPRSNLSRLDCWQQFAASQFSIFLLGIKTRKPILGYSIAWARSTRTKEQRPKEHDSRWSYTPASSGYRDDIAIHAVLRLQPVSQAACAKREARDNWSTVCMSTLSTARRARLRPAMAKDRLGPRSLAASARARHFSIERSSLCEQEECQERLGSARNLGYYYTTPSSLESLLRAP